MLSSYACQKFTRLSCDYLLIGNQRTIKLISGQKLLCVPTAISRLSFIPGSDLISESWISDVPLEECLFRINVGSTSKIDFSIMLSNEEVGSSKM